MNRRSFLALPFVSFLAARSWKKWKCTDPLAAKLELRPLHRVERGSHVKVSMRDLKPRTIITVDGDYSITYKVAGHPYRNANGIMQIDVDDNGRTEKPQPA